MRRDHACPKDEQHGHPQLLALLSGRHSFKELQGAGVLLLSGILAGRTPDIAWHPSCIVAPTPRPKKDSDGSVAFERSPFQDLQPVVTMGVRCSAPRPPLSRVSVECSLLRFGYSHFCKRCRLFPGIQSRMCRNGRWFLHRASN